jgi:quinol monooxygenase YgiN
MNTLRYCVGFLAALVFAAALAPAQADTSTASATPLDVAAAVDMAGRQRMLAQRMVKAYLMLGQNIAADDARGVLQGSIERFESQLAALKAFQPTPAVRNALVQLDAMWTQCKVPLTSAPGKAGAVELYDAGELLQKAAHLVTLAYQGDTGSSLVQLVNLAGRQRMLSQRMAKFYFYRTWELNNDAADMELHLSQAHFTAVLKQIETSQFATEQIQASTARLRRAWEPYQQALFTNQSHQEMRKAAPRVAGLSEDVLAAAEELVSLIVAEAQGASR